MQFQYWAQNIVNTNDVSANHGIKKLISGVNNLGRRNIYVIKITANDASIILYFNYMHYLTISFTVTRELGS